MQALSACVWRSAVLSNRLEPQKCFGTAPLYPGAPQMCTWAILAQQAIHPYFAVANNDVSKDPLGLVQRISALYAAMAAHF